MNRSLEMDNEIAEINTHTLPAHTEPDGLSPMVQMIANGQFSKDQIEQLISLQGMQERHQDNVARRAYHQAMSKARLNMGTAHRGTRNDHLKTSYASLDDLIIGASPALAANGFNFSWDIQQTENTVTATCRITHSAGHEESTSVVMPTLSPITSKQGKVVTSDAQTVGISITYAKRYSFSALVGIATEDHDGGRPPPPPPKPVALITETDLADFQAVCEESGKDYSKWLDYVLSKYPPLGETNLPSIPLDLKNSAIQQIKRGSA